MTAPGESNPQAASGDAGERTLSLPAAVALVAIIVLVTGVAGTVLGFTVFWNRDRGASYLETEQALWEYELSGDPSNVPAMVNLGEIHMEGGNIDKAEELFRRALAKEPQADRARYLLALVMKDRKRYGEALGMLEEILTRDIDNPLVMYQIAEIRLEMGQPEAALQNLDYIIEFVDRSLYEVHHLRGDVLERLGRKDEAVEAYRSAVLFNPGDEEAKKALRRLGGKIPELPTDPLREADFIPVPEH